MEPNPGCMERKQPLILDSKYCLRTSAFLTWSQMAAPCSLGVLFPPDHVPVCLLGCLRLITRVTPQISVLLSATGNFAPRNAVSAPEQGECPESPIMVQQARQCAPICWPEAKAVLRSCSNTTSWPKPRCVYGDKERICFCVLLLGAISWATATPMDVVKSRLQADGVYLNKYKGIIDCILQSYRNEGLKVSIV